MSPTSRMRTSRRLHRWAPVVAVAAASLVLATPVTAGASGSEPTVHVIVRRAAGAGPSTDAAVTRAGGRVTRQLGIIDGFAADLPTAALDTLATDPTVAGVSVDEVVHPQGATYAPATDGGSMYNVTQLTGAQQYWAKGYTGKGVDVAVIDSGVAPVDGMTAPGKLVHGPDLSFESQAANLANYDTYGHGTHMAGIIAGRAGAAVSGNYVGDATNFLGMAPDARIISLKVADSHGATDVSQVIAAIDWVVQHRNDPGMNIRVLNLSYGTDSTNDYKVDPLAYAAEQAWKYGIFVVAAAGNAGFVSQSTGSLTMPAKDPNIMAVGAVDTQGTATMQDDKIPGYSSNGSTARRLDLVAPGSHIVSLRSPGSLIDDTYASTGAVTAGLFRGSGTSQATAVVSGAAALVIQQRPTITPAQLKALLLGSAYRLPGATLEAQGKGELNLAKTLTTSTPSANTFSATTSTGTGSLQAARGTEQLVADGVTLSGEKDIFGNTWSSSAMAAAAASATAWTGGTFNGTAWTGTGWSDGSTTPLTGARWAGARWAGARWSGVSWSATTWSATSWLGARWADSTWSDANWLGARWADNARADATWS